MPWLGVARHLVALEPGGRERVCRKVHASGLKILIGDRNATLLLQTRKRRALFELQGVHRDVIGPQRHKGLERTAERFERLSGQPAHDIA